MGKPTGFMEIQRQDRTTRPVADRIQHFDEFVIPLEENELRKQGARCMDCGVPFCHQGCPVDNIIPDWNHLVYGGHWREALDILQSTNNFPEFTGRICPAPCEASCTLNIDDAPVTIRTLECAIIDRAWAEGWITPQIPARRTGRRVAVVGSGPAGLACAQQLARAGHAVVVYEKNNRIGGLLRFGIPNFKLNKGLIDRRMGQMQAEGVRFKPGVHVGVTLPVERLLAEFDAVVLAGGSEKPRDVPVPGRELDGVHFAMDFLTQQNRRLTGDPVPEQDEITAVDKRVVVIGGGDTGADCVGTSARQGALAINQIEIMPRPPEKENKPQTWPNWPNKLRTATSHDEGCERDWSVVTKGFSGRNGRVTTLHAARVAWTGGTMAEVAGSEFDIKADLVLIAAGFLHPVHEGLLQGLGVDLDPRGNVKADTNRYQTTVSKVFAAGDMRRGQSLVVWAIREGRQCAQAVDTFLMGSSELP